MAAVALVAAQGYPDVRRPVATPTTSAAAAAAGKMDSPLARLAALDSTLSRSAASSTPERIAATSKRESSLTRSAAASTPERLAAASKRDSSLTRLAAASKLGSPAVNKPVSTAASNFDSTLMRSAAARTPERPAAASKRDSSLTRLVATSKPASPAVSKPAPVSTPDRPAASRRDSSLTRFAAASKSASPADSKLATTAASKFDSMQRGLLSERPASPPRRPASPPRRPAASKPVSPPRRPAAPSKPSTPPLPFPSPFGAGRVAVITGAASGIGKAIALRCGKAGMKVVLVDVDSSKLAGVAGAARVTGAELAKPEVCDVTDAEAVKSLAERVINDVGVPSFLANNAGISRSPGGTAIGGSLEVFQQTLSVNFLGCVNGVQAFLPAMLKARKDAVIVNTGSKQGITKPPGNVAYNASKAALHAFTEGLQHELRETPGCKVRAHLLVPGWTNTDIMLNSARAVNPDVDPQKVAFHTEKPAAGAWAPSKVVDYLEQEMDKGVFYVVCPDNEVDVWTDNLRMTWAMGDLVEKRPPCSRWHPDFKTPFNAYVAGNPKPPPPASPSKPTAGESP